MTAGCGVIDQEDPTPSVRMHSLQLWINLAKEFKMTAPRNHDLKRAQSSIHRGSGWEVRVFWGAGCGIRAATLICGSVTVLEMSLVRATQIEIDRPTDHNGFVYMLPEEDAALGAGGGGVRNVRPIMAAASTRRSICKTWPRPALQRGLGIR